MQGALSFGNDSANNRQPLTIVYMASTTVSNRGKGHALQ